MRAFCLHARCRTDQARAGRARLGRCTPRARPGYGGPVRRDPQDHEPRAPAVVIWTVTGLLAGLAVAIVTGSFVLPIGFGALLGLAFGLYTTRTKHVPMDD